MANQTITQLPTAQALTGTELVPIVQDGGTVKTTVADIAATPVTNYSFVTATSEGSLSQSRQLSTSGNGLTLTDNGAGSTLVLSLSGAAASLVAAGTGIQVKTSATTLTARSIAAGTTGLSVADGDGVAGDPTISLSGLVLNLAQSSGVGLLTRTSGNSIGLVTLTGTASEIDVTNGTGDGANPTIGLADDPILPGTGGVIFPKGTTVERLSPGVEGAFRYNTQTGAFEGYTGAGWGAVITGVGVSSFSAGTTGFTPSTASTGAIVLNGTLVSSNGGTGLASYTAGDTLYYASGTALSKLAIGAASRIMTSSGSAPQWTDPATITVGTATSATTATNIAGGAAGSLPYQTGAGATSFLGIGTATQILKVNAGATALEYADQSTLAVGTATNLAGGTANQIAVQSNVGTTTFITAPTVASTVLSWNGAAFTWATPAAGTVTAVTASAPLASSGGTTPDISLGTVTTANGGTGLTTYTAGDLLYYATGTALSKLGIGTSTYILTSSGTAPQYTDPATITVGTATTAGSVTNSVTFNSTGGASPGTTFNGSVARTIDYSSVGAPKADGTGASGTWSISINGNAATATSATSATTATNVAGGAAGSLVYQTASATTSTLALGTQGYVLRAGASAPEWAVIDGGTF
jgi:hypothetical protein